MGGISIPSVGIAMTEALLVKWLKEPGDEVEVGEAVAEIETDKATMVLESPEAGRLGLHLVEAGQLVPVGEIVVEVLAGEQDASADIPRPADQQQEAESEPAFDTATEAYASSTPSSDAAFAEVRKPHEKSPRARRLASMAMASAPSADRAERLRELIAEKVSQAWREIPHFAVSREVNSEAISEALERLRDRGIEPRPTMTDLMLRALGLALREQRLGEGHVGLAVATPHGVMNPVVRDVVDLDGTALASSRRDAVARAHAGQLTAADLDTAVASTLSNLGPFGVDHFTGIVALGQTSLLTVGRAAPRVVAEGTHSLSIRTTFHATLNVDHRTVDGADAARLLNAFAQAAEGMSADF